MICTKCNVNKDSSDFYKTHVRCKECVKKYNKEYYNKNDNKYKKYSKENYSKKSPAIRKKYAREREELTDNYIMNLLVCSLKISKKNITKKMVKLKRKYILLKRKLESEINNEYST